MLLYYIYVNDSFAGTTANDLHFQAYLMDGLVRWNADRTSDATLTEGPNHRVYSGYLKYAVDQLGQRVLGKRIDPTQTTPQKYTGACTGY